MSEFLIENKIEQIPLRCLRCGKTLVKIIDNTLLYCDGGGEHPPYLISLKFAYDQCNNNNSQTQGGGDNPKVSA